MAEPPIEMDTGRPSTWPCELIIVPTSSSYPFDLTQLFRDASGKLQTGPMKKRVNQTATVQLTDPDADTAVFLNNSPFNHYKTFLVKSCWDTYIESHIDYPFPSTTVPLTPEPKLAANANPIVNVVTELKIRNKRPRAEVPSQTDVMIAGAHLVAIEFRWAIPGRPQIAEWLHRSAYCWGGITDADDVDRFGPVDKATGNPLKPDLTSLTSQVPRNFVFGSYECNSVMTRYESSWVNLFRREKELREQYEGDHMAMEGWITSDIRYKYARKSQNDSPYQIDLSEEEKITRTKYEKMWPWLCYVMQYELQLKPTPGDPGAEPNSWIIGELTKFSTVFYPFQRRFFTRLEELVDIEIINKLVDHFITTTTRTKLTSPDSHPKLAPITIYSHNEAVLMSGSSQAPDTHDDRWGAICKGPGHIHLEGVKLENPRFLMIGGDGKEADLPPHRVGMDSHSDPVPIEDDVGDSPRPIPNTPGEFVVKGDIKLFGFIEATLSTFQSRSTPGGTQRVNIADDLSLGEFIQELKDTPFDAIKLKNTSFTYSSSFQGCNPPGVRFHTEVIPDGELLKPVYDILEEVLGQKEPRLTFSAFVAKQPAWTTRFQPMGFSLRAGLLKLDINLWDVVNITDLGVGLCFSYGIQDSGTGKSGYNFSSNFWGGAGVTIPGSLLPMRVSWYLTKVQKSYFMSLYMVDDEWTDVLGITNLKLANVQFDVSFTAGDLKGSVRIDIQATLELVGQVITMGGSFSKSDWSIEGALQNVDLALLEEIYQHLFGKKLTTVPPGHDISFSSLRLRIGTGSFTFEGSVTLNGHTSASATISLTSIGLEIQGDVGKVDIPGILGKMVTLNDAAIDLYIGSESTSGRPYRISLKGTVTEGDLVFSAGLYFNKKQGQAQEFTIFGTVQGADLKLSSIASAVKHTFLDLELTNIAVIISNQAESWDQVPNTFKYKVVDGFQICATIKELSAVEKITRTSEAAGLVLSAVYSKSGIQVGVEWPTAGAITFNRNIKSGPISLKLTISETPNISITAALMVSVSKRVNPLELGFTLEAGLATASGKATMKDMWNDPFNLGKDVSIGDLLFGVSIVYEEFFDTGIPKSIKLGGNLAVGHTSAALLIDVSENPDDELISAKITNLTLADLAVFASTVSGHQIPAPKRNDMLTLKNFDLYLSTGVTIDKKLYPAGVQFDCDIVLFQHEGKISATIGEGVVIKGSVDSFKLGGLIVKGYLDKNPKIDIEITAAHQKITIDGSVTALGITAAANVDIEISESPVFAFHLLVQFADDLTFQLDAAMIGHLTGTGTDALNFTLKAIFKSDILEHIAKEGNEYFLRLDKASKLDYEKQKKTIDQNEAKFGQDLVDAIKKLKHDKQVWDGKRTKVNEAFNKEKVKVDAHVDDCRKALKDDRGKLDTAIKNANKVIEQAKMKLAVDVKKAEVDIAVAKKAGDEKIDGWKRDIANAQKALAVTEEKVDASLKTAEEAVARAQTAVNQINSQISEKDTEINNARWWSEVGLHVEKYALEAEQDVLDAALWLAQKTLSLVKAALDDAVFVAAKETLKLANEALTSGEKDINSIAAGLDKALDEANKLGTEGLTVAQVALKKVQTSGLEQAAFAFAQKTLDAAEAGVDGLLSGVQADVDGLVKCTEYVIFTASEKVLDGVHKNIKSLDPERQALEVMRSGEMVIEGVAKDLINGVEDLLAVKSVEISGQLSAALSGDSLKAEIDVLIHKTMHTYKLEFNLGETENFLKMLWDEVWNDLKKL